jgi:hypothetical protein
MMIRTENRLKEGYHFRNIAILPESFRSHDSFPRLFPPLTIEVVFPGRTETIGR